MPTVVLPSGAVSTLVASGALPSGEVQLIASAPDTTPPTITSPTGTATGTTTGTGTVTTDEANGVLYALASTNATELAATVISSGGAQSVTATGVQNAGFSGLTPGTTYYAHYVHRDAAGNTSTRVSSTAWATSSSGDTTPPVLSGSISVVGGSVSQTGWQADWPAATDNVAVASYDISTDGGATWPINWPSNNFTFTGYTAGTTYSLAVRARDAAGNVSGTITGSVTTLAAGASFATAPLVEGDGTLLAGVALTHLSLYDNVTGALVIRKTGLTTNSAGIASFSDAALSSGAVYRVDWLTAAGHCRMPSKAAT